MPTSKERRGLIFSFLAIYLFIVLLLAGIVTAGFHLYRGQVARSEAGLQAAVVTVEIGPLLVAAYQQQDENTAKRLMRSFFAFPAVQCVHLRKAGEQLVSWPERGCFSPIDTGITSLLLPIEGTEFSISLI